LGVIFETRNPRQMNDKNKKVKNKRHLFWNLGYDCFEPKRSFFDVFSGFFTNPTKKVSKKRSANDIYFPVNEVVKPSFFERFLIVF
jgi:hypothetical protein